MKHITLILFLLPSLFTFSQTEINVMCYNTLTYPEGSISSRADTLKKIISYETPDLLLLQELKSSAGLDQLLAVFNELPDANYLSGTYVDQISNPANSWRLQQNIIYNTKVFRLAEEEVIVTPYRDINYFKLYLFDSQLDIGADTSFVHVYNTHLKSSQGTDNEQLRLQMAEVMYNEINLLPTNSMVIAGGDFNIYSSIEPAYQELIQTVGTNVMEDPIDMPGNWHDSSFPFKEILTQSTRLSALSDGAGGGIDDRFDFMLLSETLMNGTNSISYIDGSYKALGNNGTCYNSSITVCESGNEVPIDILLAMYYMSDHLPVVLKFNTPIILGNEEISENGYNIFPNPAIDLIQVELDTSNELRYELYDVFGQQVISGVVIEKNIDISNLPHGTYILVLEDRKGDLRSSQKIVKI